MPARRRRDRVTGIGGIFFKAKDPEALARWYRVHLGVQSEGTVALFAWRTMGRAKGIGHRVWSIFPADTEYFGKGGSPLHDQLPRKGPGGRASGAAREGVSVDPKIENTDYGRFGWITGPEGNRIEFWEPPKVYRPPEGAIPMR